MANLRSVCISKGSKSGIELIKLQGDPELVSELMNLLRTEASKVDLSNPSNSAGAEEIDKLTFQEFCTRRTQNPKASQFADTVCAALLGVESNEVSALYMLHYFKSGTGIDNLLSDQKDGGQYLRNRQGTRNYQGDLFRI